MANSHKRPIEEVESEAAEFLTPRSIKRKTNTDESTTSDTSYVSAAAAIFSESESDSHETAQTDVDSDSELSTSSEEPSSESEDDESEDGSGDEEVTNVRVGVKPEIKVDGVLGGGLMNRLKTFLPKLEEANEELEKAKQNGTLGERRLEIEDGGEGQYIEMDLGLGVLQEKRDGVDLAATSDSDDSGVEEDQEKEENVIGSLMGQKKRRKAVNIEEVQDG